MFASFRMSLQDIGAIDDFRESGDKLFDTKKEEIRPYLDAYLSPDGSLKANEIEADWFPSVEADVFLSHSHNDENAAIALAGYLEGLGLKTFIDSCVWGYANNLLKQIDNRYCVLTKKPNGGCTYDYETRNYSTAHVHMILNGALMKMIDRTECFILLGTPDVLKVEDISRGTTNSCWIYSELLMSSRLRKNPPDRKKSSLVVDEAAALHEHALSVEYDADIKHLVKLSFQELMSAAEGNLGTAVLDQLYLNKGLPIK